MSAKNKKNRKTKATKPNRPSRTGTTKLTGSDDHTSSASARSESSPLPSTIDPRLPFTHFQAGRLSIAASTAAAVLQQEPDNLEVWRLYAEIMQRLKQNRLALDALRTIAQKLPEDPEAHLAVARFILKEEDNNNRELVQEAERYAQRALEIDPQLLPAYHSLGIAMILLDHNLDTLTGQLQYALTLYPDDPLLYKYLGAALLQNNRPEEAHPILKRAVEIAPDDHQNQFNLAGAYLARNDPHSALGHLYQATQLNPLYTKALHKLGQVLTSMNNSAAAVPFLERANQIEPKNPEILLNLGIANVNAGYHAQAIEPLQRLNALSPDNVPCLNVLGLAFIEMAQYAEAEKLLQHALTLDPSYDQLYQSLGRLESMQGNFDQAERHFERAKSLWNTPDLNVISGMLFTRNYTLTLTPEDNLKGASYYGQLLAAESPPPLAAWLNPPPTPLSRIGFVSGDLNQHPVGYFLEGLLPHLQATGLEIIAYDTNINRDELSARIRPYFSRWLSATDWNNNYFAQHIYDNQIQILIDLSGHTGKNRLPVFARRPAPIQMTWLGYWATTGVQHMDYVLGDPYVAPIGEEWHFLEQIWRMPETYICFTAPDVPVEVATTPCLEQGYITFGCFNNLAKVNEHVIAVWAAILNALPTAKLFLKTKQLGSDVVVNKIQRQFAAHGVAPNRLILEGASPRAHLLACYNRVDITLDPFPYPGGTTSCEALWMGTPVLTRRGDRFLSRMGESILHNAGLPDWVAADDEEYIQKAVFFAQNTQALNDLRSKLRQQVLLSPLFDPARFAINLYDALRGMWQRGPRPLNSH